MKEKSRCRFSSVAPVRSAVTDGDGQYKIIDLRPGTYTVTFTLTGFSTVRREALDLTAGFTASVNAELRVGSLEETINNGAARARPSTIS
jgi:hypothetical protein